MKKQIIALVLCVLMVLVVFTACNGNKTTSSAAASSATASKAESTATSSAAADTVKDVVIYRYGGTKNNQDVATVNKAINEYINDKYKLNATQVYIDDYSATVQLKISAKEAIDIFWCNGGGLTNAMVSSNALYDISAKLADHQDLYNSMPEKVWNAIAYNKGEIYHIPTYKESAAGSDFVIATALVDEMNWTLPEKATFAEMTPYVKELAESKKVTYAYIPSFTQASSYAREYGLQEQVAEFLDYLGVEIDGDQSKVVLVPETQAYKDLHSEMKSWIDNGYVQQDCLVEGATAFSKDTVAARQVGFGYWPTVPNNAEQCKNSYGEAMTLVQNVAPTFTNTTPLGSAYSITSYTKEIDASLSYLGALYTDKTLADLVCYGVEGTHYNRNSDGAVEKIADSGYSNGAWSCVNVMCVSIIKGESADKAEQYKKYNEAAGLSIVTGFHFDTTGLDAEIAACSAAVTTYDQALCYGVETSEITLDKYVAALKEAGVDKVLAAAQEQYTTWYNAKSK